MRRHFLSLLASAVLLAGGITRLHTQTAPAVTQVDSYGGVYKVGAGTGYFRTAKIGKRWFLVTPEGNAFFMLGVYAVVPRNNTDDLGGNYRSRVIAKYGDADVTWAPQMNRRLLSWGFNSLETYSVKWALPYATHSAWPNKQQPVKMPFVAMIYPARYALYNQNHWAPEATKDLYNGLPSTYTGWKAPFPDVFDPNFGLWIEGALNHDPAAREALAPSAQTWLIGITCDDTDSLNGYGPGPQTPGMNGAVAPHLGWITLVTNFEQTANTRVRVVQTYNDRKVYTKYALRDWLRDRYGTISALNSAWGAEYTSWDTDGGWGRGSGFLDEDGRHPWVGTDWKSLKTAAPKAKMDLDEWLYVLATKHLSTCREQIRKYAPNVLFMGPTVMNTHWGVTRAPILKAYGEQADLISISWRDNQNYLDLTATLVGDKPLITWNGSPANADSALWRYKSGAPTDPSTQSERGRLYQYWLQRQFSAAVSATGNHPFVGFRWWEFGDNWSERLNWGLVTSLDNAYDGKEAKRDNGKDQWGFRTGGEDRDYGDFLGSVQRANQFIQRQTRHEAEMELCSGKTGILGKKVVRTQ